MGKIRLSDKEFWEILRENAGIYARAARMIQKRFGIEYTRQAVKKRAEKKPDLLQDIIEENLDLAEEGLHSLMRSKNENVRFRSVDLFLRTKGRKRGYIEKTENEVTGKDGKDLFGNLTDEELDAKIADIERKLGNK